MRTKELLSKEFITRDEKIAHLKKLGLWREYCREVKREDERDARRVSILDSLLNEDAEDWLSFIFRSFVFAHSDRGHVFWSCVASEGKRPNRPKCKKN